MIYTIDDVHWLRDVPYEPAADLRGPIVPEAVVIHYTGAGAASGSIQWLSQEDQVYVSAHVVIARDGKITQLVPFNRKALHAGVSELKGRKWLNGWSIGIELANWGVLDEKNGSLYAWTGKKIGCTSDTKRFCSAQHSYGKPTGWWEVYSEDQIIACWELCQTLVEKYPITDIVGHDTVSPGRKSDPGPLFVLRSVSDLALRN